MIPWLEADTPFPDVSQALTEAQGAPGLLAAGADLSPPRLLSAYRQGIFPWYSQGQPILWWSTDPRMVLMTEELKVADSLKRNYRKALKDSRWQFRFNTQFEQVMRGCAAPRKDQLGTWITEDIIAAYCALHRLTYAHCVEAWLDGELVGGAYGVCLGKMFYGESMFARVSDASKMAFLHLVQHLRQQGVKMIDCQQETAHLARFGARPISREAFIEAMHAAQQAGSVDFPKPGCE